MVGSKMTFQPHFSYTHPMAKIPGVIEAERAVIDVLPLPPDQVHFLRQAAVAEVCEKLCRELETGPTP